ncbi:MAG: hypothetical protein Q7J73_02255 [Dehalococcoidales bacterium]|nr:hypothetical protein [Dehalococcoidales bacterium]
MGTILLAFEFVGDIGYLGTLFSAPIGLSIRPLMKRLGLGFEKRNGTFLNMKWWFLIGVFTGRTKKPLGQQIGLWFLFIIAIVIFSMVTIVTQPIMMAYFVIGRPLMAMNKLLNFVYEKLFLDMQDIYIVGVRDTIEIQKKYFGMKPKKERYSDRELLEIRKKKGELPFLAYFGLLFILAGFILQIT